MDPVQAAQLLGEWEAHEERLGQRIGGITIMVWAVVSAAIFLAYGLAAPRLAGPQATVLAVLWLPFVLAGGVITQRLWDQHVLQFGAKDTTARDVAAITLAILAVGALLFVASRVADVAWSQQGIMTTANGLAALGMAMFMRRHRLRGWTHLVGAGTAMATAGILLGILALDTGAASLLAAAVAGASWFLAGFAIHLQG